LSEFKVLEEKVLRWAKEKNIIHNTQHQFLAQLSKTKEELAEFEKAVAEYYAVDFKFNPESIAYIEAKDNAETEMDLELGDVIVTLIIAAACLNTDITYVLEQAYYKIKNRKGKVVNGIFVKDGH